jgi:hypothetical protein
MLGGGFKRLSRSAIRNVVLLVWAFIAIFRLFQANGRVYSGIFFEKFDSVLG